MSCFTQRAFHDLTLWRVVCAAGVLGLTLTLLSCDQQTDNTEKSVAVTARAAELHLRALLSGARSAEEAASLDAGELSASASRLSPTYPVWPVYTFLRAEVHRLRGDDLEARTGYRTLAYWGASNPYEDGWGGSGLASVALWRWLQALDTDSATDGDESNRLLDVAAKLRETRLMGGMVASSVLGSLPQLEEDILRRLAVLAWATGRKEEAENLFLDFLVVARTAELSPAETEILNHLVASDLVSSEHLSLMRGRRLLSMERYAEARALITKVRHSDDRDARAEAGLYLADLRRREGAPRAGLLALLDSVVHEDPTDPDVAQQALFNRAVVHNREGRGRNVDQALEDFLRLAKDFPRGRLADDALFQVARHFQEVGDAQRALEYFQQLRSLEGRNDWRNLSLFEPAITLYTRGDSGDIERASALLEKLNRQEPYGPVYLAALFWLGRMAAESGNERKSHEYFEEIIKASPYDYYAIRARMHIRLGNRARTELWPDRETKDELSKAYQSSRPDTSLTANSPYHSRLGTALETGIYSMALSAYAKLREIFPARRLGQLSLKELDAKGALTHVSLLLALRQDALAAKDIVPTAVDRLKIAGAIGHFAGDWPLVISLIVGSGETLERRAAAQRDDRFLATAYPAVFGEAFMRAGKAQGVPPELLYSVARLESLFDPAALSNRGALGLFQFTRPTFRSLDKRWHLLRSSGTSSREAFLFDPDLNIDLGARWFKDELLKRHKGNILFALMDHHAGAPAVRQWVANWERLGRADDVEYMTETIRFLGTRVLTRKVLTDMVIVDAIGTLKGKAGLDHDRSGAEN